MSVPAKKHLLGIAPYQPGKPVDEVKRELGIRRAIKLASNENPYPPSPKVREAIRRAAREANRYPDGGCFYLRRELARRLKVRESQIVFGNGSDELIVMAIRAFAGKGDEVVTACPTFLVYGIASRVEGARVRAVPLKGFDYDLAGMRKAVTRKTKIIFIGNPDNPAGTFVPRSALKRFLDSLRKDILVFVDEAYYEFVRSSDYPDTLKMLKSRKNLVVSRTFSKMYGLAGLRIGYAVAAPATAELLNRVREPFNVNALAQAAALACLKDRQYYRDVARRIERERQFLYRALDGLGMPYVPSATNFILVDVGPSARKVAGRLMRKGVIVRDMTVWGLDRYIRVTIGKPAENRQFIRVLKTVL